MNVNLRLEEQRWLVDLARRGGVSQAALIRRLIHAAAVEAGLTTAPAPPHRGVGRPRKHVGPLVAAEPWRAFDLDQAGR